MKDLTKPLGTSKSKSKAAADRKSIGERLSSLPLVGVSAGLLAVIGFTMAVWIAITDNPTGGEPIVNVRIVEPKFDNENRDVAIADVSQQPEITDEPAILTEVVAPETSGLEPINPNDIIIYDPSAEAARNSAINLSTVADKQLIEKSKYGFLPKVGENGEKPIAAYRRPASGDGYRSNSVALIIGGLGLNKKTTQDVLASLPGETTLAFAPYADGLFDWMARARGRGHELLVQMPLEPFDYPNNDPGPKTLLVDDAWDKNRDRLHWLLSRMTNYVGVVNYMGARFSASPEAMTPVLTELRDRGLLYVDDGSTPLSRASEVARATNVPYAQTTLVLDTLLNADDIDANLLELESLARDRGLAIGIASAFPVTIERLKRWTKDAEKRGIKLIPITATLDKNSF